MPDLTEKEIAEIKSKLSDQEWRLDNLYWITDIKGHKVKFQMTPVQRKLYQNRWYMNLILKSRQHGVTTFVAILFLDSVLFAPNQKALIIAHTQKDAQNIFDSKIKFAFDNLPDYLKEQFKLDVDNVNIIKIDTSGGRPHGSSISVATSGRSGTYQYLHVSEFGIICNLFPDKAQEIVTGSLNTAHAGESLVYIESTAAGKAGYFYDYCMKAMTKKQTELTTQDWKFWFLPWWEDGKYIQEGEVVMPVELTRYFAELEGKGIVLTREQKNWYVKKRENLGDGMYSEFPSTAEEAFQGSLQGAYYQDQILKLRKDGRLRPVAYDPLLPVTTFWDIGIRDSTTIGFFQRSRTEWRLIDYYEATGEGLEHYAKVLKEKPYNYAEHWGPHDLAVRELGTGMSRLEMAEKFSIKFNLVPNIGVVEGINAVRAKLSQLYVDEARCAVVVDTLARYRKKWNEKMQMFENKPLHDESSHIADMIRYWAVMSDELDHSGPDRQVADQRVEANRNEKRAAVADFGL